MDTIKGNNKNQQCMCVCLRVSVHVGSVYINNT